MATKADKIVKEEIKWLLKNHDFVEKPATIRQFVDHPYLGIAERVRPAVLESLEYLIGKEVRPDRPTEVPLAMITGGIGIGKTTIASVVLPYLAHWVLCLKDPQGFFDLLPGSRIAFMQMSTSENQAKEVVFGDIKARINYSQWFSENYTYDPNFKNQIRFPKDIWILPGDSAETTFEGYNILGGILDEDDSHKVTDKKDYAEQGFETIWNRMTSRFENKGFVLVIGQMKRSTGFAARKFMEIKKDPNARAVRMAIWESKGWHNYLNSKGERDSFFYDTMRKELISKQVASLVTDRTHLIEVPNAYRKNFTNAPEKALKDLAGIPPIVGSTFISLAHKIIEAQDRWKERFGPAGPVDERGNIAKWLRATDSLKRVIHIDIGISDQGDGLGLVMSHVHELVEVEGELKPYVVVDFAMRIKAPPGRQVILGDVRRIIYHLKDDLGYKIKHATLDGFQSTDTMQQFRKRRIEAELLSVDKQLLPYFDLRDALYEDRIEIPPLLVRLKPDDTQLTDIIYKELSELVDNGNKVDHPELGSKDVADGIAGTTTTLIGDRTYHRKVVRMDSYRNQDSDMPKAVGGNPLLQHHAYTGDLGMVSAPVAPSTEWRPPRR